MSENLSKIFVGTLANAGVKRIYGIVGGSLNPVSNEIRNNGKIQFVHMRHEESAAFAASAEAQITGSLAVCAGSAGPGNVHLMNGLYDANRSEAPVIAIASDIPSAKQGTNFFQETHPEITFQDCSKYCTYIGNPAQIPQVLQMALQTAISERGVATLVLPGDLGDAQVPDQSLALAHNPIETINTPKLDEAQMKRAAQILDNAKNVTFFCGAGCAKAHDSVIALAKKLNAPIAYTIRGKEYMGADNPHDVGMTALIGWGGATDAMNNCDALVLLGTDFPYSEWIPDKPKIIQIDICKNRLGNRCKVDLGIHGDVDEVAKMLLMFVGQKINDSHLKAALAKTAQSRSELDAYLKDISANAKPHPEYATYLIDKYAAENAIFIAPTGLGTVWCARYLTPKKNRRIIGSFTHGSMANELGMSIGAQMTCPDRQVVAICGDGSFTMLMGELLTIAQYNLPIKIFVYNNETLGLINVEMMAAGYVPFMTNMKNPDFAKLAEVMGIKGFRVDEGGQLEDVVKAAFAEKGAVLVDIATDFNAISLPPKISRAQAKNFSFVLGKMALSGNIKEALATLQSNSRTLLKRL